MKTAQQITKEINKRNTEFTTASNAEKRVLIAKDVIAQIKAKRFLPTRGKWVNINRKTVNKLVRTEGVIGLKDAFLSEKIPTCRCCGVGAMFMSCTLYNNNIQVSEAEDEIVEIPENIELRTNIKNGLNKFFSNSQLKLIEIAFERGGGGFTARTQIQREARDFGFNYETNTARLIAIMQNIIDNDGVFIP